MTQPTSDPRRETNAILVSVLMHDGVRYRGYIHLQREHRLQDLLNDPRSFIPLEQATNNDAVTIVAKRFIVSIEELREGMRDLGLNNISLA